MNCSQYRRLIEADPANHSESLLRHTADCTGCAEFTRRIQRLDQHINAALNVPVPENLEARILLRQAFQEPRRRPVWQRPVWALAASVLLVISLALTTGWLYYDGQKSLENDLIAVVNTASYALESRGPVSQDKIASAFDPIGFHLAASLGNVSFAGKCLVQGKVAGHMVLRRNGQPITLIFIPNRQRLIQASFTSRQWRGQLVPVASGTVAIIAPPELALGDLPQQVQKLVHWTAA